MDVDGYAHQCVYQAEMRKSLVGIVGMLGVLGMSCGNPTPEEMASLAAKGYYEHLLRGEYEHFLNGKAGSDSLPESYREQLLAGYRQFMVQQDKVHHGIRDVRIVSAKTDSLLHYTNVFLVLCFGDSINEQIAVPMVEQNGSWRMK